MTSTRALEVTVTHEPGLVITVEWHRTTDPACTRHRPPRTRLGQWLFDRARGRACQPCNAARYNHPAARAARADRIRALIEGTWR